MATLHRSFGREAFGGDPANYDSARPPYPETTWQALRERAGLRPGIDILEIGAGTGLATRQLLAHQPRRLVAIEPDRRLAEYLRAAVPSERLTVVAEPFETAELPGSSFDLVVCATAFHWLDPVPALVRMRSLLRPGGHVALWWNVSASPDDPTPSTMRRPTCSPDTRPAHPAAGPWSCRSGSIRRRDWPTSPPPGWLPICRRCCAGRCVSTPTRCGGSTRPTRMSRRCRRMSGLACSMGWRRWPSGSSVGWSSAT